jgi:hypothetical protein
MSNAALLYNDVVSFETNYSEEVAFQQRVLDLLQQWPGDEAFSRHHFEPGHITASGFIVNKDATKMLLGTAYQVEFMVTARRSFGRRRNQHMRLVCAKWLKKPF